MTRGLVAGVVLLLTVTCVHAPRRVAPQTITVLDSPMLVIFSAGCRWTWFDELGDTIDEASLQACIRAALGGQTIPELRAILRGRPDYNPRARKRHYNQPPTLGKRAC